MSSILCEVNCHKNTWCEESLLICVISDKNLVSNISSPMYIFTVFLHHLAVQNLQGDLYELSGMSYYPGAELANLYCVSFGS